MLGLFYIFYIYMSIKKTDKIKEKQQTGLKFPHFQWLPSLGGYFLHQNVGIYTERKRERERDLLKILIKKYILLNKVVVYIIYMML